MELLLDTDFIIKMGRFSLLGAFEDLMAKHGHPKPYRCLFEVRRHLKSAAANPTRSMFGSQVCWNEVNSFVSDCVSLGDVEDTDVLDELDLITGVDDGEQLLVEYAVRSPDTAILTADKNFIDGMALPAAKKYRALLEKRIIHLEHVVFAVGTHGSDGWPPVRKAVCAVPDCDKALHGLLHDAKKEADAIADLFGSTKDLNRRGFGTVPAPICPPFSSAS